MSEGARLQSGEHASKLAGGAGVPDLLTSAEEGGEAGRQDEVTVPCSFITGRAGTGKTYSMKERIKADPSFGVLCATTGISAVNLDAVTLNSCLGYFDTDSLRDIYLQGRLAVTLHKLALEHRWLVIDENSMMDRIQLEILYRVCYEVNNNYRDLPAPFGLMLVGDFAQLPPVKADWCFEADCWDQFAALTVRLTKMWRQDELPFLDALQAARCGDGSLAADLLSTAGVEWHTALATEFDGTTIVPKNDQVDRYNGIALDRVPSAKFTVQSRRWGKLRGEWRNIPDRSEFKLGAYVMILANAPKENNEDRLLYANGDCGHVVGWDGSSFDVELVRNHEVVTIPKLIRDVSTKDKPPGWTTTTRVGGYHAQPHIDDRSRQHVSGQVEYYPLRLAYASTIHKSQGLSLDRIQFDFRNHFAGSPAMCYVALSRCRTLAGLRLVGQPEVFAKKCKCDPKVTRWL